MKYLPEVKASLNIRKSTQSTFGGLNRTPSACDGEICAMVNISSDKYPLLSPRPDRFSLTTLKKPNGIYARDGLWYVDGEVLYRNGEAVGSVSDSRKTFSGLGSRVVILPDKVYYDTETEEFGNIEAYWSGEAKFSDGAYAGIPAAGCSIVTDGKPFPFAAGDAVEIEAEVNRGTLIIREISEDKKTLVFYENSFTVTDKAVKLTLSRKMPDLDCVCSYNNRLWGAKGDVVYASKPGDITNWYCYDGLASDSWTTSAGTPGSFTGCSAFLGFPCFFKEDAVYKVYGDLPSNFRLMGGAATGIKEGEAASAAVAGEVLFYLSRSGIMAYSGATPAVVSYPLGNAFPYTAGNSVAGSDGRRYYISLSAGEDAAEYGKHIFVYDTALGLWHREDDREAVGFAYDGNLYMLAADGDLLMLRGDAGDVFVTPSEESEFCSFVEFGPFYAADPNHKGSCKVQLRAEVEAGASLTVEICFSGSPDHMVNGVSGGSAKNEWHRAGHIEAAATRSYYLPIIPRRGDAFRLRLRGRGHWTLQSITREYYIGSELR